MKLPIVYYIKRTPAGRLVWRIVIGLIGGAITVAGAVALIGPGPMSNLGGGFSVWIFVIALDPHYLNEHTCAGKK